MKKQRALVTIFVLALAGVAVAFSLRGQSSATAQSGTATPQVPDHIAYRHLFHHVFAFKKEAEKAKKEGKDDKPFKEFFMRKAKLDRQQSDVLEETAVAYAAEEQMLNARAKAIVAAYMAQYPGGQLPHGEKPAPRPPELRALTEERDALVLRTRDRLRASLGEDEFRRFNDFVKHSVAPNAKQLNATPTPAATQADVSQ